ncbi:MAG: hypothetical protein JO214_02760, partial [Frankiaceae bacterium]|nr:hypothetical protein [Frankiaceae bacterium]
MQRAVVVGGSLGGLLTALALAQSGWDVDLVERDPLPDVGDVESAFRCHPRPAVPQAGHSHNLFALIVTMLRERAPDALDACTGAGMRFLRVRDQPPPPLAAALTGPGDEDLIGLAGRRATLEWALRRYVHGLPQVSARVDAVEGLVGTCGDVPMVTGIRTPSGPVEADLVVDASGRRSHSATWISELSGRAVPWDTDDGGAVYYTRYYRRRDTAAAWLPLNRGVAAGAALPAYYTVVIPADADTYSITLVVPSKQPVFRGLRDPARFQALAAATPVIDAWASDEHGEPISDVRVMAGFTNSIRRDILTAPYATGFAVIGDAFMHTDPTFARGISVAALSAFALGDILAEHRDPGDRDAAWRDFLNREVVSRHDDVRARNLERSAAWAAAWAGEPLAEPPAIEDVTWNEIGMAAAMDEVVWRAMNRYMHVLDRFDEAMSADVVARVRAVRDSGVVLPVPTG